MEGPGKDEVGGKESPLLQVDPKCFRDALRSFFQQIRTEDPRLDFYAVYKREATEFDLDYVKKYDEDLNTTLIFAGPFSAVSSAFVIDVYPKLQPDPNDQSAALLRAILLTLNHSAIPGESPAIPPVQGSPAGEIVTATALLYASLLISLLSAFVAMLGKQWLNRYLRHAGGSMIERCGDRQRKCDGLEKWPFRLFVESLPVMLQIALFLLASGLCRYMAAINTPVAVVLIALTLLGIMFYIGVVVAGASSYECPFQTPASVPLRSSWTKIGPLLTPVILPIIVALQTLGEVAQFHILHTIIRLPHVDIKHHLRCLLERIQLGVLCVRLRLPRTGLNIRRRSGHPPLQTIEEASHLPTPKKTTAWFAPGELATIQTINVNDVRCISWVLRNITDPEALDAAIRLAGTIRWFEDGIDTEPPYDLIVSTFRACFGSNRKVYPGSRDRAYYSARAIVWIHVLAVCNSEDSARMFPLPATRYWAPHSDHDLSDILLLNRKSTHYPHFMRLLRVDEMCTAPHLQWTSNVLLHLSWSTLATQYFSSPLYVDWRTFMGGDASIPLDVIFNRLLVCCNFLGCLVEEEALKVQDKSYGTSYFLFELLISFFTREHLDQIAERVDSAFISVLNTAHPRRTIIWDMLHGFSKLEVDRQDFTRMAHRWCVAILKNREGCDNWRSLVTLSLQIGFRRVDERFPTTYLDLTLTEDHQELFDAVLSSNDSEAIADLLQAFTVEDSPNGPAHTSCHICALSIFDLHNRVTVPSSPRLRRLFARSISQIGFERLEEVGVGAGNFVELLNHFHTNGEELDPKIASDLLLMGAFQSPEGVQHLVLQCWESLVEVIILFPWRLSLGVFLPGSPETDPQPYNSCVTTSLLDEQEWDKLECWIGVVWMTWPPETDDVNVDLKCAMVPLFRQRPGAIRKLTEWVERWSKERNEPVPASFYQTCEQAREETQLGGLPIQSPDCASGDSPDSSPATDSPPSRRREFWESLPLV